MNSPNEKTGVTQDLEKQIRDQVEDGKAGQTHDRQQLQRQREQQQRQEKAREQIPQGGPSDNGPMTAPEDE